MTTPEPREFTEALLAFGVERLTEHLVELGLLWAGERQVPPNGLKLSRSDRIMEFVEDYEDGLLEEMAIVAPAALRHRVAQFRRDIRRATPELVESPAPAGSGTFAPHAPGGAPLPVGAAGATL